MPGHNDEVLKESPVVIQDFGVQVSTSMIKAADISNFSLSSLRAVVEIDLLQMDNVKTGLGDK